MLTKSNNVYLVKKNKIPIWNLNCNKILITMTVSKYIHSEYQLIVF